MSAATSPGFLDSDGRPQLERALTAIREAAERLVGIARETPSVYSYTVSEVAGRDVWLKLENLQRTGSFKVRGAMNKVLALDDETRARGLVAASARPGLHTPQRGVNRGACPLWATYPLSAGGSDSMTPFQRLSSRRSGRIPSTSEYA